MRQYQISNIGSYVVYSLNLLDIQGFECSHGMELQDLLETLTEKEMFSVTCEKYLIFNVGFDAAKSILWSE